MCTNCEFVKQFTFFLDGIINIDDFTDDMSKRFFSGSTQIRTDWNGEYYAIQVATRECSTLNRKEQR